MAASLINILALSPQIAGTVNTNSTSEHVAPTILFLISSIRWSFKNLIEWVNTLIASSFLPFISSHLTPLLSSYLIRTKAIHFIFLKILLFFVTKCNITILQWDVFIIQCSYNIVFHFTETALNKTCKYPKVLRLVNHGKQIFCWS